MKRAYPLLLAAMLLAPAAYGSDPNGIYTVASSVEMLPNEAQATRVVIRGAFFFLKSPSSFEYTAPRCGYMYFECPAGKEMLCRMQWQDIRTHSRMLCAGFGALNMLSTATLRAEGTPLGTPDPYDLGMGVSPGVSVGGQCPPARMLSCPAAAPDAAAAAPDTALDMAPSPKLDATVDAPAPQPDAGTDAGATIAKRDGGGFCALAVPIGAPGSDASAIALAAVLALALRLRRRARR